MAQTSSPQPSKEHRGAKQVAYDRLELYEFYGAPSPDGVTEASLDITLPRNALVQKYELVLHAAPAHAVTAADAGQVRTSRANGKVQVVIDFGTPRTVRSVTPPDGVIIESIATWLGTHFGPETLSSRAQQSVELPSEVRTERLLLRVTPNTQTDALANGLILVLPESPSGLELRIDGAAPVFSQLSAVDPSNSSALSAQAWNEAGERVVDIAPALAALTGDPLDETSVTFHLTLTSRTPGQLRLELRSGGQDVLRIRRATFNSQASRDLAFDTEGRQELGLDSLPSALTVKQLRLKVLGKPPEQRALPPLGPEPASPEFAQITLNPNRAACIRLPTDARFSELSSVRLPLAALGAGAEARLVLWQSRDDVDSSPAQPLPNGASEPTTLEAGSEAWRTFTWKKPLVPPADVTLWAALVLGRGEVSLVFTDVTGGVGAEPLLWGASSGPWHDLPSPLATVRARIRIVGRAKSPTEFAPLTIQLGSAGASMPVLPTAKGTAVVLSDTQTWTARPTLVFTSYAPGSFSLQDIDVVSTG